MLRTREAQDSIEDRVIIKKSRNNSKEDQTVVEGGTVVSQQK